MPQQLTSAASRPSPSLGETTNLLPAAKERAVPMAELTPNPSRTPGLSIALTYVAFSALWIVVTDWGLDWSHLTGAPAFAASAAKGLIFVFASGALIYWLVDRDSRRVARANALFKLVADGTTDAVFVKDRAGKYLLFNPAASQFVGKSVVEVLGKDDRELFDPASAAEVMGHDQRVMTRGEPDTEAETLTAVGVTRTYLVTKAPFRDDTGRVVGLIGIGRDVTRLREVERAAHESDERLRFALEGARGGAWYWDLDTGETWWSKELYDLWGVPNGRRMDYGSAIAIVEPADHDSIRAAVERAVATKTPYHAEFRIRHPVLGERWMTSHGRIVGADEGRKGRLLGISLDVTDRKRAEVALQGEQQRLFQLAQSAPGVICSFRLDPNGKTSFPYASPGIIDIYGIRAEDLSVDASGIFELIHPDDAAAFQASIDESRSRMTPWHQTYRVVQASGRERWIEGRAAPSREPDGGMLWHGYLMDVTDRKRDEAALSAQHALLRSQLEASPDGILLVSQEGRILSYNQRLLEIWGISEEIAEAGDDGPMLKLATQRTSHPEAFEARVHEIYSKPELRSHDEVAFADGRTVERYSGPIRDEGGRPLGRVWYFRDVTDWKDVEQSLAEQSRADSLRAALAVAVTKPGNLRSILQECSEAIVRERGAALARVWTLNPADHVLELQAEAGPAKRSDDDQSRIPVGQLKIGMLAERRRPHFTNQVLGDPRIPNQEWVKREGLASFAGFPLLVDDRVIGVLAIFSRKMLSPEAFDHLTGMAELIAQCIDRKRTEADHQRAEAAVRERERLLRVVTESARVGLVVVNQHYEYLFTNEAYSEIFQLEDQSLVGRKVSDVLSIGWAQIQPRLDRALAGEQVAYELKLPATPESKGERWFRVMYQPRDRQGEGPTVVVVVLDISENKRTEAAIRDSEERYRRLIDVLPGAVFTHSLDEIVFCNPAFVRLMRAKRAEDLTGRNLYEVVHPHDHGLMRAQTGAANDDSGQLATGTEMRVVRLDGRSVPVHAVSTPISGVGPSGVLTALSDLTDRERSMELLRSVLGSVSDSILTINADGIVQSMNPATERMFGYSEMEVLGNNIRVLMPEPYRTEHDGYIANFMRTGVAKVIGKGREVEGRRKDGAVFPLELTVTEFQLDGERRFTGVVRDITARKRLEEQFLQAQKMEAIGQLAGGVAHDFNNLLTVITGYSDMLLMEMSADDRKRNFVVAVMEAGERAARLTQQLLAFSRKAIVELKLLDLNELVAETTKMLRRLIGEHVTLTVNPDPALGRIKVDVGQIEQVVMNLVVNGRDAMPHGGRLTIETRDVHVTAESLPEFATLPLGRYAQLTVADTGEGMTNEVKARIFEPFFTTKGIGKGTGLGLAVVHGVVAQCGGRIFVESAVGVGTTFTLLFPVAAESTDGSESKLAAEPRWGIETILLVEDEDAVRTIARIALESRGYQVLTASRGREALELVDDYEGAIHLLVTDVVMPEMGGRQLAAEVLARRPETRIMYMSGYTDDLMLHSDVLDPAAAFLQKPFTPLSLTKKVREVLDRKR